MAGKQIILDTNIVIALFTKVCNAPQLPLGLTIGLNDLFIKHSSGSIDKSTLENYFKKTEDSKRILGTYTLRTVSGDSTIRFQLNKGMLIPN